MKKYLLTILAAVFASLPAFSSMGSGGTRAGGITPDETEPSLSTRYACGRKQKTDNNLCIRRQFHDRKPGRGKLSAMVQSHGG